MTSFKQTGIQRRVTKVIRDLGERSVSGFYSPAKQWLLG